jgi:hypothetical protein
VYVASVAESAEAEPGDALDRRDAPESVGVQGTAPQGEGGDRGSPLASVVVAGLGGSSAGVAGKPAEGRKKFLAAFLACTARGGGEAVRAVKALLLAPEEKCRILADRESIEAAREEFPACDTDEGAVLKALEDLNGLPREELEALVIAVIDHGAERGAAVYDESGAKTALGRGRFVDVVNRLAEGISLLVMQWHSGSGASEPVGQFKGKVTVLTQTHGGEDGWTTVATARSGGAEPELRTLNGVDQLKALVDTAPGLSFAKLEEYGGMSAHLRVQGLRDAPLNRWLPPDSRPDSRRASGAWCA